VDLEEIFPIEVISIANKIGFLFKHNMNTFLYKPRRVSRRLGLLITTYPTGVGAHISSIILPCGTLLSGHAKCMGFLRKYTNNQDIPDQKDSSTNSSENYSQALNSFSTIQVFKDLHVTNNLSLGFHP
jgi:hypothetical protein